MVFDIKKQLGNIPDGEEMTILIRTVDGLLVHEGPFLQFVQYLVEARKFKALIIFQIYKYTTGLWHPRMVLYKGLRSVWPFPARS
jgi:hypothetical protein